MRSMLLTLTVVAGSLALAAQSPAPPPAAELARRLQAHYDTVRDFTAEFTQEYRGGVLRQTLTESGRVRIKKPGRMEWIYTDPVKKTYVSDGSSFYMHFPSENVVQVRDLPTGAESSTALSFLAGHGSLVRDFHPALPGRQPEGAWQLDLIPKADQAEFTSLTLLVDPRTLALRGLSSSDSQGGVSTFVFRNLRENVGLSDRQFVFQIPRGADVQR